MTALAEKMNHAVKAMAKMEGGVKILLDIDRVLNTEEVAAMEKVA